jgi:signal transduction histidine kinase/ActR/RegA family two-component response regulator
MLAQHGSWKAWQVKNSLGRKVFVASIGTLALLFACYVYLALDLAKWNGASSYVMLDYRRSMLDGQLHAAMTRAIGESAAYALTGNHVYEKDAEEALAQAHEAVRGLRQALELSTSDLEQVEHEAFLVLQERLLRQTEAAVRQASTALSGPGKTAGTAGAAETVKSIYAQQAAADALWAAIVAHHTAELLENEQTLHDHSRRAQFVVLAGVFAIALALGLMIYYVRRHIVQPISVLARLTGRVAAGDLTGRSEVTRGTEIGQLQHSFNAMVDDLATQRSERATLLEGLANSRDVAHAANRAKSEFLANVSHEIRTPLHGVLVSLDLLRETAADPAQRELLDTAGVSARSLLRMLNDLLDFSLIEAGNVSLEAVNFGPRRLVDRLVGLCTQRAADKGLALGCRVADDVPARLCGDPARIGQVLMNLLDNAIKFTGRGSIDVSVSLAGPPSAAAGALRPGVQPPWCWLRIAVTDTGVGIPREAARQISKPFYRAERVDAFGQAGLGLGLGIARQLAASMNGEFGFASEIGKGSTFWFTVRLQPETLCDAPEQAALAQLRPFPAGASVLLVEDQRDIRDVMALALQRRGLRVTTAENGRLALACAKEQKFDLILMDCRMPVMDGFEATRAIRALGGERGRVPIVAVTAYGLTEPKQRYLDAGFDDLVVKPCSLEDIEAALHRWLVPRRSDTGVTGQAQAEIATPGTALGAAAPHLR